MQAFEVNFDGIVGPSHNYAGLSYGNLASTRHLGRTASPRQAALQGLKKMQLVSELGIRQAVLPPHRRPRFDLLRALGLEGSDTAILEAAWKEDPALVAACYSASSMWTANAATVSPSADCRDGRLHLTPANLGSGLHRSIESADTTAVLRAIFADTERFCVHDPLPAGASLSDEGAANHTRLCPAFERQGLEVFVFGQSALDRRLPRPAKFPARQTREACQAIARHHRLDPEAVLFVQQNPAAIDAGVFHNDVISVGNAGFLVWHELAFADGHAAVDRIREAWRRRFPDSELQTWRVGAQELSLDDAVNSYLFNSQLLTLPRGGMLLLCPSEVSSIPAAKRCADAILAGDNPVAQVQYVNLRESMDNGGGPACLRLRVVMTEDELAAIHPGILFTPELSRRLEEWVRRHYRDELRPDDLRDPRLADEIRVAFEDLAVVLDLPPTLFGLQGQRS